MAKTISFQEWLEQKGLEGLILDQEEDPKLVKEELAEAHSRLNAALAEMGYPVAGPQTEKGPAESRIDAALAELLHS